MLGDVGRCWEMLGSVGKCWEVLRDFGMCWDVLGCVRFGVRFGVGRCWEVLGGVSRRSVLHCFFVAGRAVTGSRGTLLLVLSQDPSRFFTRVYAPQLPKGAPDRGEPDVGVSVDPGQLGIPVHARVFLCGVWGCGWDVVWDKQHQKTTQQPQNTKTHQTHTKKHKPTQTHTKTHKNT